ncbi:MAG: hypothetical protein GC181_12610 [Bacteroidetes bacterium]|nr:hypothetical protein [Bacteroidota bacterium]
MNNFILTDTCFWIGLLDVTDQYHNESMAISDIIQDSILIIPYPCLYESLNTKLIRNKKRLAHFEQLIRANNIQLFGDEKYRESALEQVFSKNKKHYEQNFSLVDAVLREILKDVNVKIEYLISYNEKDFYDICAIRNIHIIRDK